MKRVRVLVVDDSLICREVLRELLEVDGDIKVVGEAESGDEAVRQVERLKPHVTTMDVQMPGLGGLEAIEHIMAKTPVPILVITGRPVSPQENLAFEAVQRGALDLIEKPMAGDTRAGQRLRSLVRTFADVPVVRHVGGGRRKQTPRFPEAVRKDVAERAVSLPPSPQLKVIGVGASAGGPAAVTSVLSRLPRNIPAAVALVQHLPPGFAGSFAEYLRQNARLPVKVVRTEEDIEPGVVFTPDDDRHLAVTAGGTVVAEAGPRVGSYRPSVTRLFESMADVLGPHGVGVILSGMGNDGAAGLCRMFRRGGYTIAQDEATSAVYGMPKAAREAGGIKVILSLDQIPSALVALTAASPDIRRRRET